MLSSELQAEVILGLFRGAAPYSVASAADARAWRADDLRAARLAQATLERLPVSAAWLLSDAAGWAVALEFCRSTAFEDVVRTKCRLLDAMVAHIEHRIPGPLLVLEHALANGVERVSLRLGAESKDSVRLAPGVSVVEVPAGFAQTYGVALDAVRGTERADRWTNIVSGASMNVARGVLRFDGSAVRQLVVPDERLGATVETVEGPLGGLLWFLRPSRRHVEVAVFLEETEGLSAAEVEDLLSDLAEGGLISLGPAGGAGP